MIKMFLPDLMGDSLGGFNKIVLVNYKVQCPAYRKPINVNHITVLSEDKCPPQPPTQVLVTHMSNLNKQWTANEP